MRLCCDECANRCRRTDPAVAPTCLTSLTNSNVFVHGRNTQWHADRWNRGVTSRSTDPSIATSAFGRSATVGNRPSAVVQVSGKRTSNYFTRLVSKRVLLQYVDFFGSRYEARENSGVLTRTLI